MTTTNVSALQQLTLTSSGTPPQGGPSDDFFLALARAWSETLDKQAKVIQDQSDVVSNGGDKPSDLTLLTAESAKMSILANDAHTSQSEASEALKAVTKQ